MTVAGGLRQWVGSLMGQAKEDLARLVEIESVSDLPGSEVTELDRCAGVVVEMLVGVGLAAETVRTDDGSLTVIGRSASATDAPTVLLYTHYDVQPSGPISKWGSPPFELTERDGRWFGRGAADCKGNLVAALTALRALASSDEFSRLNLILVCEGSEEVAAGGLERLIRAEPERFQADVVLVLDVGNAALGVPTLTTSLRGYVDLIVSVKTMERPAHSGMYGGPAPDALAALIQMLGSLRDAEGDTVIDGVNGDGRWPGRQWAEISFRHDARILEGVETLGSGSVSDMLWSRPAVTVTGIDAPGVEGAVGAISPEAAARLNLRVPPGMAAREARQALMDHLKAAAPWGASVDFLTGSASDGFLAPAHGPMVSALAASMEEAFGHELVTLGQGGGIPLCAALRDASPTTEFALFGVEEPASAIHSPDESVDPNELARTALALALFLGRVHASGSQPACG